MAEETRNEAQEGVEGNAFLELAPKAVEEHVKFENASIAPGFVTFISDVDVSLDLYKFKMPAGVYLLKSGEELNEARVYTLTFDADEIAHIGDGLPYEETTDPNTGVTMRSYGTDPDSEPITFSATIEPIPTKEGEFLTYVEYVAWLTMAVAPDDETRKAIFKSAYQVAREDGAEQDGVEQTSGKADKRYDPVTKLHQSLSNPAIYGELELKLEGRGEAKKGKKVRNIVALEYVGDDEDMRLSRPVSEFDIQVYNAVASLWEAGKHEMTLQEIFNMTMGEGKANPEQLDRISDSVELLRRTRLTADITQEARAHKLTDPDTGEPWEQMEIDDFLFNALRVRMKSINGKVTTGYKIHATPILLRYAKASKQIVSYPVKYLDTKSAGSNTERNVVIRGYLLQRIAQAKGGKMSKTIRCATIYEKAGIDKTNRTERGRANKYITALLSLWVEQGFISSYAVENNARGSMEKVIVSFSR